jgi:putative nucleotidyltransferase with HDIG domain
MGEGEADGLPDSARVEEALTMSVSVRLEDRAALPAAFRDAFVARMSGELRLPLLPDTAVRVLAACQDERTSIVKLVELVTHDQSLAAHLLRVANSVGYAPSTPILSLQQALGRVGLGTVSDVAMAVALRERVFSVPRYQDRIQELWRHSATTACYAKEIAQVLRRDMETAFLCGLLHDVGMPLVLQLSCDLEREQLVPPQPAEVVESAMQIFHAELGARMAEAWNLGPWIRLVIRHHHHPAGAKYHPDELPVVALADALAYWAVDPRLKATDFHLERSLGEALRLHEGALGTLLERRSRVLEAVEAFA